MATSWTSTRAKADIDSAYHELYRVRHMIMAGDEPLALRILDGVNCSLDELLCDGQTDLTVHAADLVETLQPLCDRILSQSEAATCEQLSPMISLASDLSCVLHARTAPLAAC